VLPGIAVLTHRRLFQFLLGASGVKLDPVLKGKEARDSFMHINDLKKKYAAITAKAHPRRSPRIGAFSEIERAALLRNVIDALVARCNSDWSFNVWHKHGLSRIYFSDDSWLSYSPEGVCIFGPDKSGTAYQIRSELGLKKPAIRSVVL
jgi:hypothetical protein